MIDQLPVGDPTLSDKEIISNESQERMGIAIGAAHTELLKKVADRERAPMYVVGEATGDHRFVFARQNKSQSPVDLEVKHLFGSSPKTVLNDVTPSTGYGNVSYDVAKIRDYVRQVLQLESVACKDWLTNKVDRSVTGKVATQQTCGALQLPLNNVSVMAIDFLSHKGIATSIGHAPVAALVNAAAGSRLAIAEALTNLVWAPLTHGLTGVSLSANWMWPAKNEGENARLYQAVEAISQFAIELGINIPTGKDSLSMTQKYPNGDIVYSPGTVIISSVAEVQDIRQTVSPDLAPLEGSSLLYIDFSKDARHLGGSSLAQVVNALGADVPTVRDAQYFAACFGAIQNLIRENQILSGHDISSGGLITTLLEMCFAVPGAGLRLQINPGDDLVCKLFAENPGVVIQVANAETVRQALTDQGIAVETLGTVIMNEKVTLLSGASQIELAVAEHREVWFDTSYLFDKVQRPKGHADLRKNNLGHQPLAYQFQPRFNGTFATYGIDPRRRNPSGIKAAIIREKGVNGDREMAYALYLAGFDVKDVHMTDLVSGREDLRDVNLIVFVGGFSNSDVLGSAKGWAGAFLYNAKAKTALENFYNRPDTLSLGVCNGCQVMMELGLVYRELNIQQHPKMHHNGSGKFESAFINVTIPQNHSVMLQSYAGARLGVWLAHGEGRFRLPADLKVNIGATFAYAEYPGNPNDSDGAVAALYSHDGRHLAIMPHIERSLFTWNWPHYPESKLAHEVSPWIEAFVNARDWVAARVK